MCPYKSKVEELGHIKGEYVTVKEKSEGARSHKRGICARIRAKWKSSVT
jgi:hypothetical protein